MQTNEKPHNVLVKDMPRHNAQEFFGFYLVSQKELREGKTGFFLKVKLTDKTGSIIGFVWNNAQQISTKFSEGDVVKLKGVVKTFNGQHQVSIDKIRIAEESEYELDQFIAKSDKDLSQLSNSLFGFIDRVKDNFISQLLKSIFEDNEILKDFSQAPAAKGWHHNYIGGLLEHTVAVARICEFSAEMYPVDKDILIAGALLHDIGKIKEYAAVPIIEFTDIGRLVGHICLADQLVCERSATINGFPEETLLKIRHLILSHHGEYEKASARLPQTIEAVVLHYADNLDAQTTGVKQLIDNVTDDESRWTEFDKLNGRYIYIG